MKKIAFLLATAVLISGSSWCADRKTYETQQELVGDQFGTVAKTGTTETTPVEQPEKRVIETKGDWIYVDGEKFFIKGVGYSGWRPHQLPWQERPDPELMENDFRLISEAGFNTIRTWSALNAKELALARKYNLMVMQGIFVDPTRDFASPIYQNYVVTTVKNQVRYYLKDNNILMFMVANEPPAERVRTSGVDNTEKVLKMMVDAVKELDPDKIVTFSNWIQLAFIDHSMFRVIAFNVYIYAPDIVSHALKYKGCVEWLKKNVAGDKPLIISEFGLSVSAYGPGNYGRGGNTEEEQRDGTINMYEDLICAGATGGCAFEWNDEWWKNYDYSGDQHKHETSDPEEWFGIMEIKDETSDYKGRPRLIYQALKEYQQALIINPKDVDFYRGAIPVEIYTVEKVKSLFFRVDAGAWNSITQSGTHWWRTLWESRDSANGKHVLEIKALDEADVLLCSKKRVLWINNTPGFKQPGLKISLTTDKDKYICRGKMETLLLTVNVVDEDEQPVVDIPVDYAFYESRFWQGLHGTKNTDDKGKIEVEYYVHESGFINIGAAVLLQKGEYQRRFGDIIAVEVEREEPPKTIAGEQNEK